MTWLRLRLGLWCSLDLGLVRALGISLFDFRFPGPAPRLFALQCFLGLVGRMQSLTGWMRSFAPSLDLRFACRPLFIPATPAPVAPGPVATAAALIVAVPFGPLLLPLRRRLLSWLRLKRL